MAQDGGGTKKALISRISQLRRSRARALLSLNLKKKRDCSQSKGFQVVFYYVYSAIYES